MIYSNRVSWETLRTFDSATLNGSFQALGSPLLHPSYKLKIVNNSSVLVTISINGTTNIDVLPANSFFLYDEGNVGSSSQIPAIPQGTQFYVNGAVVGIGLIYLATQYIVEA